MGYLGHHYYVVKSVLFLALYWECTTSRYCFMPGWSICYLKSGLHQLKPCFIKASCMYLTNLPYFNSTSTQALCHSQHMLLNYVPIYLSSISVGWHDHNMSSWFERHTNKTRDWPFWVHLLKYGNMSELYVYYLTSRNWKHESRNCFVYHCFLGN